jgi:hypothetical protein
MHPTACMQARPWPLITTPCSILQRLEPGSLSEPDLRSIHEQWARFWGPVSPADRNRLLAQSMKVLTEGDPWALDMAKQDGKEYV